MALSALVTWEVRTGGDDTNGGGFKTGASGTDRSQQDAAQASLTTAATVHTTTTQLNVPGGEFTVSAADVGNIFQLNSGTATAGVYEITAVDVPNNRWTVDKSLGTAGQTAAGKMGGGFASIGKAGSVCTLQQDVFVKSGAYNLTSATQNIAGGCPLFNSSGVDKVLQRVTGYNTTRTHVNTDATKPVLTATAGATFVMFESAGGPENFIVRNIECSGGARTGVTCFKIYGSFGGGRVHNCKASSCANGFDLGGHTRAFNCEALSCTVYGFLTTTATMVFGCYAHDGSGDGFVVGDDSLISHCIADTMTGKGFKDTSTAYSAFYHCTAYNNGSHGFEFSMGAGRNQGAYNCLADSNGGFGFRGDTPSESCLLVNCAYRNNTSGNVDTTNITSPEEGSVLLTGSPFVDGPNANFALNNTAGAGAACKGVAAPTTFLGSATVSYLDIGAVQHQDTGGGTTGSVGLGLKVVSSTRIFT